MEISNESWIQSMCNWLRLSVAESSNATTASAIATVTLEELESFLQVLLANFDMLSANSQRLRVLMQALATRYLSEPTRGARDVPAIDPCLLTSLYQRLCEVEAHAAAHALQMLAAQGDEESIDSLAATLTESPPADWQSAALAISPLWNAEREPLELFFDRLDDSLLHPSSLSVLLDLAGYSLRKGKLSEHPWRHRHAELASLLAGLTGRLSGLESDPSRFGEDVADVQRILAESISLTISLCDALGLMGHREVESSLTRALALSHRRIQTEAAGALARLGFEAGQKRLIDLAFDPVARLRAVRYAEELGFAEKIDETMRYPQALAESELAAWLSQLEQFGFPPNELELIDSRTMYWPSYEEPRDCYLFRYTYRLPAGELSNIGMAGPLTHAFHADLTSLTVDHIYAAFAGWQTEHEDIFEVPMPLLNNAQRREADRLIDSLATHQLVLRESLALTFFLGEVSLLALVEKDGQKHCAITDGIELLCFAMTDSPTSLSPEILLSIFRGRKLLRTFNA